MITVFKAIELTNLDEAFRNESRQQEQDFVVGTDQYGQIYTIDRSYQTPEVKRYLCG